MSRSLIHVSCSESRGVPLNHQLSFTCPAKLCFVPGLRSGQYPSRASILMCSGPHFRSGQETLQAT